MGMRVLLPASAPKEVTEFSTVMMIRLQQSIPDGLSLLRLSLIAACADLVNILLVIELYVCGYI